MVIRRRVGPAKILEFFSKLRPCLVGMEACATAHARSFDKFVGQCRRPCVAEADKDCLWHNYLLPIQRIRDGAINAVAAVPAALIQTK